MDPTALAEAGAWAVVVAMIAALGWGFARGILIPGFVYRREVERGDRADAQAERTAKAVETIARLLDMGPLDERKDH